MCMEKSKSSFLEWIKIHKKSLILAGVSITVLIGVVLSLKNKEVLIELWKTLEQSIWSVSGTNSIGIVDNEDLMFTTETLTDIRTYTRPSSPVDVRSHIRELSSGRCHSVEKAIEAANLGISLLPHQTLVDSYRKYVA